MAKDHFIPASLIAQFSEDPKIPLRNSMVSVVWRNGKRVISRAEAVGYSNNLYNVDSQMFPTRGVHAVDAVWGEYERHLPGALSRLIEGNATALDLVETLVPFVAASFARDRGYKDRVARRIFKNGTNDLPDIDSFIKEITLDDTNIAINRVIEMDRFAARCLASTWTVCETAGDIILPDVGYGFDLVCENPVVVAQILPIGKRHYLCLTPSPARRILIREGEGWVPVIGYAKSLIDPDLINRELAKTAQDFVVGTSSAVNSIEVGHISVFDWAGIDDILSYWPYSEDTRNLLGLHHLVRSIALNEINSLEDVFLESHASVMALEPLAVTIAPNRNIPAARYLSLNPDSLIISVN